MAKKLRIILVFVILLSVIGQRQILYSCHTEGTVHMVSSCCDKIEAVKSCCASEVDSKEVQIKRKCCSQFEVKFTNSLTSIEYESLKKSDDSNLAFYLPVTYGFGKIYDKTIQVNSLSNNSLPCPQRNIYVEISSFLC
jgi:hypothetical protein